MAWIESHQELREHPKVYKMMEILQISKPQVLGHLHLLWWWCVDYSPDGVLRSFTDTQIARAVVWDAEAKMLINALVQSGFLDREGDVLIVHDWLDFCGELMHKRLKRKEQRTKVAENGGQILPTNQPTYIPTNKPPPKSEFFIKNSENDNTQEMRDRVIGEAIFDDIWRKYPKKLGRKQALRHFKASVQSQEDVDNIKIALKNYVDYLKSKRISDEFIQHGRTWFNNWRDWLDYKATESKLELNEEKRKKWIKNGLSDCHGAEIIQYDDGTGRCNECLCVKYPPKMEKSVLSGVLS